MDENQELIEIDENQELMEMGENQELIEIVDVDIVFALVDDLILSRELDKLFSSVDPNDKNRLNLIVIEAATNDYPSLIFYLLNLGYEIDVLNDKNQTLTHLAYYSDTHDTLLQQSKDLLFSNCKNYRNYIDCNGLSHLHIACATGCVNAVKQFLDNGEDIHARLTVDCNDDKAGFTPLHFAVAHHQLEVVTLLLERGADINAADYSGSTVLHVACTVSWDFRKFLSKELLINHIYWAAELSIFKLLLEHNCDLNSRDQSGNTPLLRLFNNDCAYYCPLTANETTDKYPCKKEEVSRLLRTRQLKKFYILFESSIDITLKNNNNETILHCVIQDLFNTRYGISLISNFFFDEIYADIIELLLKANMGLDVNAKNKKNESPIVLAVSLISHHIVKVLLDYNVELDEINIDGPNFFRYPKVLLNEDTVINLEKTISRLVDKGFQFMLGHNLAIMKFLAHDVDDCDCGFGNSNKIIPAYVGYILYYGSAAHTKRIFMKVYESLDEILKKKLLMCMQLFLEFCKLAQYPLFIDQEFLELLYEPDYSVLITEITDCKNDVTLLKSGTLNNGMNLQNFLMKSPSLAHISMYFIHGDKEFGVEQEFEEPNAELLIRSHFTKSMVRIYIESSAQKNYMSHLLPCLPDLCHKMILEFLNNEDILRLCEAVVLE